MKIHPSPSCESPLKLSHLIQLLEKRNLIANCVVKRTPLRLRLLFYIIHGLENAQWKNSKSMANCGINFFIVIFHFLLVKAEVTAPHLCKLKKTSYRQSPELGLPTPSPPGYSVAPHPPLATLACGRGGGRNRIGRLPVRHAVFAQFTKARSRSIHRHCDTL